MELRDDALPLHKDARLQIRPRILLEGNFFVDLKPGSPVGRRPAPTAARSRSARPARRCTLGDVLSVLESDTRDDLRTLLQRVRHGRWTAAAPRRSTARSPTSSPPTG